MRALLLFALVGGCDQYSNGFGVALRLLADGAVASQTATFHVDVANADSFQTDFAASAHYVSSGEERVLYRPAAKSGTLDFDITAKNGNGEVLATGQAHGVALQSGKTVERDVHLTAAMLGDLAGADLTGFDLAGVDLAGVDLAGGMPDLAGSTPDLAGADLAGAVCSSADDACNGATLHKCRSDLSGFDDTTCSLGCSTVGAPHCMQMVPSANGPTVNDLDPTGLADVSIIANATLDGDTGAITGVRAANANPDTREIISGIAFHRVAVPGGGGLKIGIFSFKSFLMGDGKTMILTGPNAIALVAAGDVNILGTLDARGTCTAGTAGPGGGHGGTVALGNAAGLGKGTAGASNASDATSGGGGGGFGDDGGSTLQVGVGKTTLGGVFYGPLSLVPIVGGSGGGRGGDGNSAAFTSGGNGGGGGGALQIVAGGTLTVGTGSSPAGINAGGCGGGGAAMPASTNGAGAGGGGGSGGAVLLEAPTVKIDQFGGVAVNGGAGGGGAAGVGAMGGAGDAAHLFTTQTTSFGGAPSGAGCGGGGFGGASNNNTVVPASTTKGSNGATGGSGGCTGGGGGGAGRIRINTLSGAATLANGGFTSPQIADTSTHAENLVTQGMITTQ